MLNAGASCTIDVAFTPTAAGLREAQMKITDAQSDSFKINFAGTGNNLAITPPATTPSGCTQDNAYTYCNVAVGASSAAEQFTLDSGGAATGVHYTFAPAPGLAAEFNAADFTVVTNSCPQASCTLNIAFTPTAAGLRVAELVATDDQGDSTSVTLGGLTTGNLTLTTGATSFDCVPANSFAFCNEPTAGNTPPTAFTLTNNSGSPATVLNFTTGTAPTDFSITSNSCTATLAAGATCTINVAFTPQAAGLRQGTLTVTDAQGDVAAANLAGTGDNFSLQIVPSQPPELTVIPGGTATFMAQVNADSVFGQNGEKLVLVCPSNVPTFATCAFNPCPVSVTPGTATPFSIVIVTASAKTPAPPVASPCPGTSSANAAPGGFDAPRGPRIVFQVAPQTAPRALRFPAPVVFYLVLFAILAAMAFAIFGARVPSRRRVPFVFGIAGLAAAILLGCGGHSNAVSTATPTGVTTMTILANATDSSGKPINASRAFQITLDVVAK
jgi:hypothetical protein